MCLSKKGGAPAEDTASVEAEQKKQEEEAAAAKKAQQEKAIANRAAELELARTQAVQQYVSSQAVARQKEAEKVVSSSNIRAKRIEKFGSVATAGRASRRSGSRSRRSLITGLGGGIGYYDRFAS
jgi:hypothetical protein